MKIKVTGLGEFKSAMAQSQTAVRLFNQELKQNEAQFKATGDKEQYLAEKTNLLKQRMQAQKEAAEAARKALDQLEKQQADKNSPAYQKMAQQLSAFTTGMLETQVELQNLTQGEQAAAQGADQLTTSVNGISKKVSLDAVLGGIDKITSGMERAAKKAVELGRALWEEISKSGSWADNTATTAAQLGMGIEDYQRYQKVFDQAADITVADWQKAKQKVQKAINDPSQETTDILNLLGIQTHGTVYGKNGVVEGAARNYEEVFWEIGERLRQKVASGEMTQDLADTYANSLFGKGFSNLNPIFALGQEGFAAELEKQNVVSEEAIKKLAEMNDAIVKLQGDFKSLETESISGLAPGLTAAAKALDGLLGKLLEYLQTDKGQQMLERLGTAVSGLFEDMGKIDPGQVVEGFVSVFESIINGFEWLVTNKGTIEGILMGIVTAWGAANLTGGALQVLQLINGIRGLTGGGSAAAAAAGAASGASWGAAFASAAMKAAPWLAGIYILTEGIFEGTHDNLGNNTLYNPDGSLSAEGQTVVNPDGTLKREGWEIGDMRQRQRAALEALWDEYRAGLSGAGNSEAFGAATKTVQKLFSGEAGLFQSMMQQMHEWGSNGSWKDMADLPEDFFQFDVQPKVDENAAAKISEEIGTVEVPVVMVTTTGGDTGRIRMPRGWITPDGSNANGLPFVPFDGYISVLHRGERVLPAQENRTYTANSNLYVQNMNMNNGMDAQALAAAMRAQQERTSKGFGS